MASARLQALPGLTLTLQPKLFLSGALLSGDSVNEPQKMTHGSLPPWSPLLGTPKPRFSFAPRYRQDQQVPFDAEFLHQLGAFYVGITMRDDAASERVSGHRVSAAPSKKKLEPVEQLFLGHVLERLFELVPTSRNNCL